MNKSKGKQSYVMQYHNCKVQASFSSPQVYIPKRRTLIQVLPPANAYTKSAHAYIHFEYHPFVTSGKMHIGMSR